MYLEQHRAYLSKLFFVHFSAAIFHLFSYWFLAYEALFTDSSTNFVAVAVPEVRESGI